MLETLHEMGGQAEAGDVIDALNDRLNIPDHIRNDYREMDFGKWGTRRRNPWRQTLHWVRQNAVTRGLMEKRGHGVWGLSNAGRDSLVNAEGGLILIVYETSHGQAIWAEARTAAAHLQQDSVQLIFTSPPYPILNGRKYGSFSESEILELLVGCARDWKRALTPDGSLVLNLRDVWRPKSETGGAVRSLYQEKLLLALAEDVGLYFADRFYWRNPSHSPESCWVTVHKVRTNNDVEHLFWLGKSPTPFANTREVMVDAKPSTIETYLRRGRRGVQGTTVGPSTQNTNFEEQMQAVANGQSLKVIPRNYLEIPNSDTHRKLREALKAAKLPRHDAMMPERLAEFFVRLLTRPQDCVYDPFYGSGTTGKVAEELGRRWIGSDRSLAHVLGSALRFPSVNYGAG